MKIGLFGYGIYSWRRPDRERFLRVLERQPRQWSFYRPSKW